MSARDVDRGLRAVGRVRAVRERDSRIGLQQALAEREERRTRLAHLEQQLATDPAWEQGDTSSFLAHRTALLGLGEAVTGAREQVEAAGRIAETAHAHWSGDKVRLAAVESLLERRAQARRAERAHREATELDDIAAQGWSRRRADASPTDTPPADAPPAATPPTSTDPGAAR